MATMRRARQITTTLILASALAFSGGCKPPVHSDPMAERQEEVKSQKRVMDSVPVPQKKEETKTEAREAKEEPKKGKIEETPQGKLITTEWGMKILIKKDGTTEILERPEKKPMPESIH